MNADSDRKPVSCEKDRQLASTVSVILPARIVQYEFERCLRNRGWLHLYDVCVTLDCARRAVNTALRRVERPSLLSTILSFDASRPNPFPSLLTSAMARILVSTANTFSTSAVLSSSHGMLLQRYRVVYLLSVREFFDNRPCL